MRIKYLHVHVDLFMSQSIKVKVICSHCCYLSFPSLLTHSIHVHVVHKDDTVHENNMLNAG